MSASAPCYGALRRDLAVACRPGFGRQAEAGQDCQHSKTSGDSPDCAERVPEVRQRSGEFQSWQCWQFWQCWQWTGTIRGSRASVTPESTMRFGISTHLYHDQKLDLSHLAQVAGHGFESIELFATRTHFDYRDPAAVSALGEWLKTTGLGLHSVHAPITDRFGAGDKWAPTYSIAAGDTARRQAAVNEVEAALAIAKQIPFKLLVVHLGDAGDASCGERQQPGGRHAQCRRDLPHRRAARRAGGARSHPERAVDASGAGDAAGEGSRGDAQASAWTSATPSSAETSRMRSRSWPSTWSPPTCTTTIGAMTNTWRRTWAPSTGTRRSCRCRRLDYDGTYLMELANTGSPADRARGGAARRQRIERALARLMIAYIEDIARHEGQTVTLRGWLHNRRSSGKIHFLRSATAAASSSA